MKNSISVYPFFLWGPSLRPMTSTDVTFSSHMSVQLMQSVGGDSGIIAAARVSTQGAESKESFDSAEAGGMINFLMANRHGSPFEHNSMTFFVSAPIFVFREFHRHRIGWCLAGETEVWGETISASGRTLNKRTIESMYENWHNGVTDINGRTRHLPSCRNFTVRTLDEETGQFILSKVLDIYKNGVKSVVKMTTEHGESVRATTDHAVWTPSGWAKIGDLNIGDLVARNGKVSTVNSRQIPKSLRAGIGVWTSMQRPSLINQIDFCYLCGETFDEKDLELDHIVPVVSDLKLALDVENLAPACIKCHRVKTNSEQELSVRGQTAGVVWTKIESIVPDGETETYDIELEGPNRGFVANGLVVHNSYNEESGRYKQLDPKFYVPYEGRNLKQIGKPGHYEFVPGEEDDYLDVKFGHEQTAKFSYANYKDLLERGIAKEVARMTLPVNIYSSMYASCNARSLMAFLSLRTKDENSTFPSFPQREIEMVAEKMEAEFATLFPITHKAFCDNGRVCP